MDVLTQVLFHGDGPEPQEEGEGEGEGEGGPEWLMSSYKIPYLCYFV